MSTAAHSSGRAPRGCVLIAGGGGFLGSATARCFIEDNWRVATLGFTGPSGPWAKSVRHFEGLIQASLLEKAQAEAGTPDVIIHAAGGASVGRSWDDPKGDFDLSVGSCAEILDFMRRHAPNCHLVLVSSAAIYGAHRGGPLTETVSPNPVSPYGLHKLICEQLVQGEAALRAFGVTILRLFSIYGEGLKKQILWDALNRLHDSPDSELELWGQGTETRDFLHVDDAARLILRLSETREETVRVYNGGAGRAMSVRTIGEALVQAAGLSVPLSFNGKTRTGDPRDLVADASKLSREIGFEPQIVLETGLARYVEWFRRRN